MKLDNAIFLPAPPFERDTPSRALPPHYSPQYNHMPQNSHHAKGESMDREELEQECRELDRLIAQDEKADQEAEIESWRQAGHMIQDKNKLRRYHANPKIAQNSAWCVTPFHQQQGWVVEFLMRDGRMALRHCFWEGC